MGAVKVAGILAGPSSETGVIRRRTASPRVSVSAMRRYLALFPVRIGQGLKIRVSAVRFCPWPLSPKFNSRVEISPSSGAVATRVRFGGWRGFWRDHPAFLDFSRAPLLVCLPLCLIGAAYNRFDDWRRGCVRTMDLPLDGVR